MKNQPKTMKIFFSLSLLIIFSSILFSCSDSRREEGDWDDNIKLSRKTVEFNASADSVLITTEGSWWWINNVSVNGTYFHVTPDIDVESDHYLFKQDCFIIERRNKNTLSIKLEANALKLKRIVAIELEAGDYFDRVVVTQNPKL